MKISNPFLIFLAAMVSLSMADRPLLGKGGPFGFSSVEIFKVDRQAHGLAVADLDSDGRPDLVVANNAEATIDLFYQRPPGAPPEEDKESAVLSAALSKKSTALNEITSHSRFRVEKFYTERHVHSLVVGDFNSDGKPDLAYYTDPPELHVVFQGDGGSRGAVWGDQRETLSIRDGNDSVYALVSCELGGDGRDDLVLLGKKKTYLLEQKAEGGFGEPTTLYGGSADVWAVDLVDLNADQRLDLIFFDPNSEEPFRVRLQGPSGFGPEIASRVRPIRSWFIAPLAFPDEPAPLSTVFTVQKGTDRIKAYRWGEQPTRGPLTVPRIVPMRPEGEAKKRLTIFADVDHNGRTDIVVAHPKAAQLEVFFQGADGELGRRDTFPTLAEVNGLRAADVDGDGRAEIVVSSRREKVVGVSRWREDALEIPRTFPMTAEPVLLATGPVGAGDGARGAGEANSAREALYVVAKTKDGYSLFVYTLAADSSGELELETELKLAGKGGVPSDLRLLDANGDGARDLLVFVPYEDPFLYLQDPPKPDADGGPVFREISRLPGFGLGQLSKVEPAAVSVVPHHGDQAALLVASTTYVRLLQLRSEKLEVVAQLSGRSSGARLSAAIAMKGDDGSDELAVFDSANNFVELYRREDSSFRFIAQIRVPKLSAPRLVAEDLDGDSRQDLVLTSPEANAVLYRRAVDAGLKEIFTHTLKNKKDLGPPLDVIVGDLNTDSNPDVVLVTGRKHNLLFLTPGGDAHRRLDLQLGFPVFEEKSTSRRSASSGPRQMLISDVNQDGLNDLLLLVHDRILLYLQDAVPLCSGNS